MPLSWETAINFTYGGFSLRKFGSTCWCTGNFWKLRNRRRTSELSKRPPPPTPQKKKKRKKKRKEKKPLSNELLVHIYIYKQCFGSSIRRWARWRWVLCAYLNSHRIVSKVLNLTRLVLNNFSTVTANLPIPTDPPGYTPKYKDSRLILSGPSGITTL